MHDVWGMAALWLGLALLATLISIWFRIATALSEIVVGTVAHLMIGAFFAAVAVVAFAVLPFLTPRFFARYGGRPSELETKYLLMILFGLGSLATWAESEAVLPAYVVGMVLAGTVGKDHALIRRLGTLTFGMLTPFYFIRAGSYVSVPAIAAAPFALLVLFLTKMATKLVGVYPATKFFRYAQKEGMYTTLLMSTGLTFGSISALFVLSHGIIDDGQYSLLIVAVIGSAVIPTLIANAFFLPRYLLPSPSSTADGGGSGAVAIESGK